MELNFDSGVRFIKNYFRECPETNRTYTKSKSVHCDPKYFRAPGRYGFN